MLVYLDHIVVSSKNEEQHYKHQEVFLQLFREHQVSASLPKVQSNAAINPAYVLGSAVSAAVCIMAPNTHLSWTASTSSIQQLQTSGFANCCHERLQGLALLAVTIQQKSAVHVMTLTTGSTSLAL